MKRKKRPISRKSALLLTAAALLLIGSGVGSTRAALTYYSENYTASMDMSHIGVTLVENDKDVAYKNYDKKGNVTESEEGVLLSDLAEKNIVPEAPYTEELAVRNSGNIDEYVRVTIRKSWKKNGEKVTTLSPNLIELNILEGNGWKIDSSATTSERTVLYYKSVLGVGDTSNPLSDTIKINGQIAEKMKVTEEGNTITYEYEYDGVSFCLDVEVDAVQTHNAADAIKSAWGVDASALDLQL